MIRFLIYAHSDPQHLARLCDRLNPYPVYVHIDSKVSMVPYERALAMRQVSNVTFTDTRVRVNWAGYSQVDAMRLLIRTAAGDSSPSDYFVMLSGQDYPLKSPKLLDVMLGTSRQRQFIKSFLISDSSETYLNHVAKRHHRDLTFLHSMTNSKARQLRNLGIRLADFFDPRKPAHIPSNLRICHGQTHWALTAACATDLEASITSEISEFFSHTFAPDEMVFHSLAASRTSPLGTAWSAPIDYVGSGNWRYTNLHHVHPSLTKTYTMTDWAEVMESDRYFIRKVSSKLSAELLDSIDARLLNARFEINGTLS